MNTTVINLVAGLAWAGVAISNATPADAIAVTTQSGTYAACAANYVSQQGSWCKIGVAPDFDFLYDTAYRQQIKMVTTACNQGGCNPDASEVYVDAVYPVGRKVATLDDSCGGGNHIYSLGPCAC